MATSFHLCCRRRRPLTRMPIDSCNRWLALRVLSASWRSRLRSGIRDRTCWRPTIARRASNGRRWARGFRPNAASLSSHVTTATFSPTLCGARRWDRLPPMTARPLIAKTTRVWVVWSKESPPTRWVQLRPHPGFPQGESPTRLAGLDRERCAAMREAGFRLCDLPPAD